MKKRALHSPNRPTPEQIHEIIVFDFFLFWKNIVEKREFLSYSCLVCVCDMARHYSKNNFNCRWPNENRIYIWFKSVIRERTVADRLPSTAALAIYFSVALLICLIQY